MSQAKTDQGNGKPQNPELDLNPPWQNPIARFLLGAGLGVIFPLVYLSYVWYFGAGVTAEQLWLLSTIAIGCGSCGVIWGNQFLAQLVALLENLPSL